jgi:phospholipase C
MGNLDNIEHIVVLMMENRSFDNILGFLYPGNSNFYGVDTSMSNPYVDGSIVHVAAGTDMTAPFPDPNEPYQYVYRQMFNESPKMPIPNTTEMPSMDGFVIDYADAIETANAKAAAKHKPIFTTSPDVIMNCFAPESLPVINGLAKAYAVCDNWFSSVPTQTFPNRSFIHAATSSGNVYNTWSTGNHIWDVGIFINKTPTIYNLLEENRTSWKIYHGGPLLLCNTLIIQEKLWEYAFTDHFAPYSQAGLFHEHTFLTDIDNQTLPSYSFIEPNMVCSSKYGAENDMHPAWAVYDTGNPTNVLYGDQLIYDIYMKIFSSEYYWDKTLFVITFDEHGGTFDHFPVKPSPLAVSPDGVTIPYTNGRNGGSGFNFERFGVRVPAVLVSPWIAANTISHTPYDHTSVIKTVSNKWLGGQNLTARDKIANDVSDVITDTLRGDTVTVKPITPPEFTGCHSQELSPLQRDLLAASAYFIANTTNRLIDLDALDTKDKVIETLDNVAGDFLSN